MGFAAAWQQANVVFVTGVAHLFRVGHLFREAIVPRFMLLSLVGVLIAGSCPAMHLVASSHAGEPDRAEVAGGAPGGDSAGRGRFLAVDTSQLMGSPQSARYS
jgi:hypothetical protein